MAEATRPLVLEFIARPILFYTRIVPIKHTAKGRHTRDSLGQRYVLLDYSLHLVQTKCVDRQPKSWQSSVWSQDRRARRNQLPAAEAALPQGTIGGPR
uniref:Uncharacterized protein n=1 Tax=Apteryx owenii TaxID=8824 RepID=A0A8B9S261_APTOW